MAITIDNGDEFVSCAMDAADWRLHITPADSVEQTAHTRHCTRRDILNLDIEPADYFKFETIEAAVSPTFFKMLLRVVSWPILRTRRVRWNFTCGRFQR